LRCETYAEVSKRRTGRVILRGLGHSVYPFNAPPTRHPGRRGELILFRGAIIIAVRTARPQMSSRTGEVSE
jgi:hypothetical protein